MRRLCGGTFFTLLSGAGRPLSSRPVEFMGMSHTATDTFRMTALLMILNPEFKVFSAASFSKLVSRYRNCEKVSYGADLPLNDSRYTAAFRERILSGYPEVLREMKAFCDAFIDSDRQIWLVRALIETIEEDTEIDVPLYIQADGKPKMRSDIREMDTFCLLALLTGCWAYIVCHGPENTVGKDTLRDWCYEKEFPNERQRLRETIGASITRPIHVSCDLPEAPQQKAPQQKAQERTEREELHTPVPERTNWPTGNTITNYYYGTVNNYSGPVRVEEGIGALELFQLDREYYNLFVVANESFLTRSFMLPKAVSLSAWMDHEIRKEFLALGPADVARLTRMPAIFTVPNDRFKHSQSLAIVGRLTELHVQGTCIRFDWKPYCLIPQKTLNENERAFDIWCAPAANELDDEHWSIKNLSLLDAMNAIGFNPFWHMA